MLEAVCVEDLLNTETALLKIELNDGENGFTTTTTTTSKMRKSFQNKNVLPHLLFQFYFEWLADCVETKRIEKNIRSVLPSAVKHRDPTVRGGHRSVSMKQQKIISRSALHRDQCLLCGICN